jgi:hypothetical protein
VPAAGQFRQAALCFSPLAITFDKKKDAVIVQPPELKHHSKSIQWISVANLHPPELP